MRDNQIVPEWLTVLLTTATTNKSTVDILIKLYLHVITLWNMENKMYTYCAILIMKGFIFFRGTVNDETNGMFVIMMALVPV